MAHVLDNSVYEKIVEHTDNGNDLVEKHEDYLKAIDEYMKALSLIPEPIEKWEASTWVLVAIGDCYFLMGDYVNAHQFLTRAMYCPDAIGNGFIHLRLGQVQFELGNEERAKDELGRAYMIDGEEPFEFEDSKYLIFLRQFMRNI